MAIGVGIVAAAAFALVARAGPPAPDPRLHRRRRRCSGPHVGLGARHRRGEHRADLRDRPDLPALHHRSRDQHPAPGPAGRRSSSAASCSSRSARRSPGGRSATRVAGTGGRFDRLYLAVALSLSSTLIVVKLLFDKFEMAHVRRANHAGRPHLPGPVGHRVPGAAAQPAAACGRAAAPALVRGRGGARRLGRRASPASCCPALFRSIARSRPSSCWSPPSPGASSWPAPRARWDCRARWAR